MDNRYYLGTLEIELHLPQAHSLKEKRRVLRRLKDRLPARFKVAIAEIGYQDKWQRACLVVAAVSSDYQQVNEILNNVRRAVEMDIIGEAVLLRAELDIR